MKRIKAKNFRVIVYETNLSEPDFFGSEVVGDIDRFKTDADLIVANRATPELADVAARYSRAICSGQINHTRGAVGARRT